MHLGLNQRLGLSRNKVAVPEGVAGTPPFWSSHQQMWAEVSGSRFFVYSFIQGEGNSTGLVAQVVRALH